MQCVVCIMRHIHSLPDSNLNVLYFEDATKNKMRQSLEYQVNKNIGLFVRDKSLRLYIDRINEKDACQLSRLTHCSIKLINSLY